MKQKLFGYDNTPLTSSAQSISTGALLGPLQALMEIPINLAAPLHYPSVGEIIRTLYTGWTFSGDTSNWLRVRGVLWNPDAADPAPLNQAWQRVIAAGKPRLT